MAPTVVEHLQYDAFGQITDDSNPSLDTRYAYTGREWDADAELYYYRARWYDPAVGSFISEDPTGFGGGDANLQGYAQNGPTSFVDPLGLSNLPSPTRGTWIEGTPRNGTFRYSDSNLNREKGVANAEVRFENMDIAIGGFPPEWYYGGSADAASVDIDGPITGTSADDVKANAKMKEIYGDEWQQPPKMTWNHAGSPPDPTSTTPVTMELVDEDLHRAVKHLYKLCMAR